MEPEDLLLSRLSEFKKLCEVCPFSAFFHHTSRTLLGQNTFRPTVTLVLNPPSTGVTRFVPLNFCSSLKLIWASDSYSTRAGNALIAFLSESLTSSNVDPDPNIIHFHQPLGSGYIFRIQSRIHTIKKRGKGWTDCQKFTYLIQNPAQKELIESKKKTWLESYDTYPLNKCGEPNKVLP